MLAAHRYLAQLSVVVQSIVVKCSAVQCSVVQWYRALQCSAVQCSDTGQWSGVVQDSGGQFSAVQWYMAVLYNAVQCSGVGSLWVSKQISWLAKRAYRHRITQGWARLKHTEVFGLTTVALKHCIALHRVHQCQSRALKLKDYSSNERKSRSWYEPNSKYIWMAKNGPIYKYILRLKK